MIGESHKIWPPLLYAILCHFRFYSYSYVKCSKRVWTNPASIVQLCQMLQASLDEANLGSMSPEELEAVFIQSVYASLGASLVAEAQTVFDAHVKNLTGFLNVVDSDDRLANYTQIPTAESSWYHYTLDR
ncbi:dynein heavy chain 10, axonemal-like, partial [Diaphorina citri]|uniref:Dynein heavy chain 10, axonemal-like n=1 Tax=Diaphorina citri TaxID=121845 RepID=A0A1S3DNM8_DIACI